MGQTEPKERRTHLGSLDDDETSTVGLLGGHVDVALVVRDITSVTTGQLSTNTERRAKRCSQARNCLSLGQLGGGRRRRDGEGEGSGECGELKLHFWRCSDVSEVTKANSGASPYMLLLP